MELGTGEAGTEEVGTEEAGTRYRESGIGGTIVEGDCNGIEVEDDEVEYFIRSFIKLSIRIFSCWRLYSNHISHVTFPLSLEFH